MIIYSNFVTTKVLVSQQSKLNIPAVTVEIFILKLIIIQEVEY